MGCMNRNQTLHSRNLGQYFLNINHNIFAYGVYSRHNKCMQCYKDLVKIRSLILKRQTMPGKLGHTYRELSILMQYLD